MAITRLSIGWGARRVGSFAGKVAFVPEPAVAGGAGDALSRRSRKKREIEFRETSIERNRRIAEESIDEQIRQELEKAGLVERKIKLDVRPVKSDAKSDIASDDIDKIRIMNNNTILLALLLADS